MNDLRSVLRQHDPARNAVIPPQARARIRAALLEVPERPSWPFLRPLAATAISLLVLLTITFTVIHRRDEPAPRQRRIEYTTPGGTRIIWTVDPSFHM